MPASSRSARRRFSASPAISQASSPNTAYQRAGVALLAAGLVAAALGFVTSFLVLRGSDLTRLMVTLGVSLMLGEVANRYSNITGGADGLQGVDIAPILGRFRFDLYGHTGYIYSLSCCSSVLLSLAASSIRRSACRCVRSKATPWRAAAIGIPVKWRMVAIYTFAAVYRRHRRRTFDPDHGVLFARRVLAGPLGRSSARAHHRRHPLSAAGTLPAAIRVVYDTLANVGNAPAAPVERAQPAVPIRKSVFPDYIICLEDGKRLKMLKRHLSTSSTLTPEQDREKWGMDANYPMVAPNYAERRSELAKQIGLGTHRTSAAERSAGLRFTLAWSGPTAGCDEKAACLVFRFNRSWGGPSLGVSDIVCGDFEHPGPRRAEGLTARKRMELRIERLCIERGLKMTGQRRVIARVLSDAGDHPDVEELYRRGLRAGPAHLDRHRLPDRAAVRGDRASWSAATSAVAGRATSRASTATLPPDRRRYRQGDRIRGRRSTSG